jgi:hypothetical protein
MNKKLMEWWHSHRLGEGHAYAKLVLMFLALDADKSGHGTTSRRRLSRDANLPENDVIDRLIELEKMKLIEANIDERGGIDYQLNLKKKGDRTK